SAGEITTHARTSEKRIHEVIGMFRDGLLANATRDIRLTTVAAEIRELVGKMVVSVQSQDIVTQRLAHSREAIDQLRQRLAGNPGDALPIARVAGAQFTSVQELVAQTERDLRAAVAATGELLQRLETSCVTLPEFRVKTVGDDGLCAVLTQTISDFHGLV
ncbi:hypothetical protein, partial [Arcanobacterium phocae]|uniref:hypothetical protein n=1 Tax=Arcanobacterium phocae TaxID=131112 RepID=UPI001C105F7B